MHKSILIISVFTLIILPTYSATKIAPLLQYKPYSQYHEHVERADKATNYAKINQAEQKIFGRTFLNEDITNRLSRLEKKLFNQDYRYLSLSERTENISDKIGLNKYNAISVEDLTVMEQRIFMKIYPKDDIEMRITRLEKEIFGAVQGGDLDDRFETLKSATKYYNAFPPKLSNQIPYYSNPYHEAWQKPKVTLPSIMQNIGNFFAPATMTGFSPNIVYPSSSPYSNFNSYNMQPGMQHHYSDNGMNYNRLRHYGTGSSVHILQD